MKRIERERVDDLFSIWNKTSTLFEDTLQEYTDVIEDMKEIVLPFAWQLETPSPYIQNKKQQLIRTEKILYLRLNRLSKELSDTYDSLNMQEKILRDEFESSKELLNAEEQLEYIRLIKLLTSICIIAGNKLAEYLNIFADISFDKAENMHFVRENKEDGHKF